MDAVDNIGIGKCFVRTKSQFITSVVEILTAQVRKMYEESVVENQVVNGMRSISAEQSARCYHEHRHSICVKAYERECA